ncbi:EamA family transporter [Pseudosulfitobacter sp. SM2401]|uniref:DMT family transporter n=1 Tax=Pseudosulfitobacter sp. SM2401 TaxID=3350098 RepID=UPI0036F262BA
MAPVIKTDPRSNVIGALWMVAAMIGFAIEDMFLKVASQTVPIGQVLVIFGAGGVILFAITARVRGEPLRNPQILSRPMIVRACFEVFGRLFYVLAIALSTLSSATAILQATPIVVVAGAAVFFGEKVGMRRWSAIFVGLIGVMIVLRPTASSFDVFSIFAVLGMLGFAGRDLATRAAPVSLTTSVLGVYGFLAIVVAGLLYSLWEGTPFIVPTYIASGALGGAIIWGVLAYSGLMRAMRVGEVSVVTPFRYSRLLVGLGFGVLVFNETLDAATLIGCGLIVASGLYILARGRRV